MKKTKGMIDVSSKRVTKRVARARCVVKLNPGLVKKIKEKTLVKGDAFEQARVAGIMAAKKTGEFIPLCHPLGLDHVGISFRTDKDSVTVETSVISCGKTGVEMEALVAASMAALTIYDLCKMYTKDIEIKDLVLLYKSGGKSGTWRKGEKTNHKFQITNNLQ